MTKNFSKCCGALLVGGIFLTLFMGISAALLLRELSLSTEKLATRHESLRFIELIQSSLLRSGAGLSDVSLIIRERYASQLVAGQELKRIAVKDQFSLTSSPSQIHFHTNRSNTPGRLSVKSKNIECTTTLSLRGRVRTRCGRR